MDGLFVLDLFMVPLWYIACPFISSSKEVAVSALGLGDRWHPCELWVKTFGCLGGHYARTGGFVCH